MSLATCPECHRHVKVTEAVCPFCSASLPPDLHARVQNRPINRNRFGRAALVSFSAAVATATAACSSDDDTSGGQLGQTRGGAGDAGVSEDGGMGIGGSSSGGNGSGGAAGATIGGAGGSAGGVAQPVYGIPIDDPDPNIGQPEYGVPIDFDASAPDDQVIDMDGGTNSSGDSGGEVVQPVYGIPVDMPEP